MFCDLLFCSKYLYLNNSGLVRWIVCVWERERERERVCVHEREWGGEKGGGEKSLTLSLLLDWNLLSFGLQKQQATKKERKTKRKKERKKLCFGLQCKIKRHLCLTSDALTLNPSKTKNLNLKNSSKIKLESVFCEKFFNILKQIVCDIQLILASISTVIMFLKYVGIHYVHWLIHEAFKYSTLTCVLWLAWCKLLCKRINCSYMQITMYTYEQICPYNQFYCLSFIKVCFLT